METKHQIFTYTIYIVICIVFVLIKEFIGRHRKQIHIMAMKIIHRPRVMPIMRAIFIPIFLISAFGSFACPKPCDTTFIDQAVKNIWGNKAYKKWHAYCLHMHYSIICA